MPRIRDEVKVVFNNGTLIEGIVLEWGDNRGEIFTKQGAVVEIFNVDNNVLFVKIANPGLDRDSELEKYVEPGDNTNHSVLVEEKPEEVVEKDSRLRAATIAELKIEKANQLRETVARRLRSKKKPAPKNNYYESPNFTQSSPIQDTSTENHHSSRRYP